MDLPDNKNVKRGLSQTQKILLGAAIVAVLCLCAGVALFFALRQAGSRVMESIEIEPTGMSEVGGKIAEFDIPPGYEINMAMSFMSYDMISLMPTSDESTDMSITMMQMNNMFNVSPEQMDEQFRRALEQQNARPSIGSTVVEQRTETIRGEEVTVTISESTLQGITIQQWQAVFRGNNGPTMLMIQGSADDWDDELIETFIKSIH